MQKISRKLMLFFLPILFLANAISAAEITKENGEDSQYLEDVESDLLNHGIEIAYQKLHDKIKAAPEKRKEAELLLKFLKDKERKRKIKKRYGEQEQSLIDMEKNFNENLELAKKLIPILDSFQKHLPTEPKYTAFTFYISTYIMELKKFITNCPPLEAVKWKIENTYTNRRHYLEFREEFRGKPYVEYVETFFQAFIEHSPRIDVNIHMNMLGTLENFFKTYCAENFFAIDVLHIDGDHFFTNDQIAKNNHIYDIIKNMESLKGIIQDRIAIAEEIFALQRIGNLRDSNFETFKELLGLAGHFFAKYPTTLPRDAEVSGVIKAVAREVPQSSNDGEKWTFTRLLFSGDPVGYTVKNGPSRPKELKVFIASDDPSGSPKRERKNSYGRARTRSNATVSSSLSSGSQDSPKHKRRSLSLKRTFSRKVSPEGIKKEPTANQVNTQVSTGKENKTEDDNITRNTTSPREFSPRDKSDPIKRVKHHVRGEQVPITVPMES